jgi:hypothetical protein
MLNRQARSDSELGDFLVRMGLIDHGELRAMLALQAELRSAHKGSIPGLVMRRFRLGRLLVDSGVIDAPTLNGALARGRRTRRRLGESLVASAALSTLAPAPAAAGDTAHLHIIATVLARASIEAHALPHDVAVTQADIDRGYIELEPVEIGVQSNHPGGVRVGFVAASSRLSAVDVEGGGSTIFLAQSARGLQRQRVSVRLRLRLAPGVLPGTIASPVSVFLTPA